MNSDLRHHIRILDFNTAHMADLYPKFIIETDPEDGDCLIIGKCTYHKQLAYDTTQVKGGGWWRLSEDRKVFTLSMTSHEFGSVKLEQVWDCIIRCKVFTSYTKHNNISSEFTFKFIDECGTETVLTQVGNDHGS
jgi:hypothetical protein